MDSPELKKAFLIADIGGTNPRLALHDGDQIIYENNYKTEDFAAPEAVINQFITDTKTNGKDADVSHAVFAAAGPVTERQNFRFPLIEKWGEIDWDNMEERLGFPIELVNDFDAQAMNVRQITRDQIETLPRADLRGEATQTTLSTSQAVTFTLPSDAPSGKTENTKRLIAKAPEAKDRFGVIGSGTALGAATVTRNPDGSTTVLSSQMGVVPFTPTTDEQQDVFKRFVENSPQHKSGVGNIAGGQGLVDIYTAAHQLEHEKGNTGDVPKVTAEQVSNVAFGKDIVDGIDPKSASTAMEMFTHALAQSVQTMILTNNTRGGVFLSGGVIEAIKDDMDWETFETRLMNIGEHHHYWMKDVPVHIVKDSSRNGIEGAAVYVTGADPAEPS